uniref:MFS transporter n=1 Tax=Burkholderia anthina TaxID=179879 RepID=UPI001FC805E9
MIIIHQFQRVSALRSAAWAPASREAGPLHSPNPLPHAARDLAITIPQAGHLISIYALGVVIGAPLLAILGARWPRRSLLVGLMLVFALGNLASAIAPGFGSMALARLLTGFPHGTYFGVAALVAAGLVPRERRTQAVAMVLLGLTLATLLG